MSEQNAAKTILAYSFFDSPEGELVLTNLENSFGTDFPAFVPSETFTFCPYRAALRDGQRQVLLHIRLMQRKSHATRETKAQVRKD